MASNIISLDPTTFSSEVYLPSDEALITSNIESNQFDVNTDYVEFFVFDLNDNKIIPSGNDATFSNYSLLDNEIYVDPQSDLENVGIDTGIVNTLYNFYRKWLSSSPQSTYYIKEISSNRTEIRLDSNIIGREEIIQSVNEFISYRETDETFPDFYINLGSNLLFIANNIRLEEDGTVLIKLYEPLPSNIELKTSLWVIEKVSEGVAYRVEFEDAQEFRPQLNYISGPNLNLSIKDELNNPSEAISLSGFTSPNSQSEYQINSYFEDPSISINVDYTDFSNFINFSSAETRLRNFWDKVSLIETSSLQIADLDSLTNTPAVSASKATLNAVINDTITTFDSYEYYLYFESSSVTYPKSPSTLTPPYQNVSTGSSAATTWSASIFQSAEDYDRENPDWLYYSAPEFLRDDPSNAQYMTFLNMVGHFVDNNIWVYLKDTTNKWDADNRIDAGVSKDLVAQVLRDLGVKIYQNNYSSGDLYSSFLGFTDSGSLFPFPNMTGSLPTPSGYEYISNFISSSDEAIPLDDINKHIYKRIYHNLPYLLKSKGTVEGLRTLINIYGIPDTILRISEFGGKDRNNVNDWDLWNHQYNFKSNIGTGGSITTDWELTSSWNSTDDRPDSLQFRFNAGLAVSASATQSLWDLDSGTNVSAVLEYDTSLLNSGSYSGSVKSEEYQYATLKFTLDNFSTSASVRLPFYNNDWWSVQINREGNDFELLAGNKIYSGSDGSQIGFIASSSITTAASSNWGSATTSKFDFEGSYQEIRYFNQAISQSVFKDYVMNPQSIEGNGVNGSPSQLAFRASLGGELYTGSESIHPKVDTTSSFTGGNSFTTSSVTFEENKEWIFYDSPAVGIKNRNTDKIKRQDLILPEGNTLSNLGSIQQKSYTTQDYTNNLNLLEVAFSPQNQINDDIISQIGHFNIGDYIGDPRLVSSSANTYPSLVDLSQEYFDKYSSNYDVYDYIRLIKFFDNSLFKMIKDFTPARTGLATGIVIKQHILERQKYPTPQTTTDTPQFVYSSSAGWNTPSIFKDLTLTGSIGQTASSSSDYQKEYIASTDFESNPIVTIEGGAGGSVNEFNRPVGFFRIVDTPNVVLNNSTFTTLLDQSPDSKFAGPNNPGLTLNPTGINNGEFKNGTDFDFTTNFTFQFKNPNAPQTITIQLVEVGGGVLKEVSQVLLSSGSSVLYIYYFNNVTLKSGKSYYFRAKTSLASQIISTFDVRFFQEDAPVLLRNGQFYNVTNTTPLGDVTEVIGDNYEFYNGEFSGSSIITTDGELNTECDIFKEAATTEIQYYLSSSVPENTYDFIFTPGPGSAYTMMDTSTNDGLKVYLQWSFDRSEQPALSPFRNYFWNVVGFSIKVPESANTVDVEDYITSLKELKLLDVNFIGSDVTGLTGWSGIISKTFTNVVDPVLIPKSFKKYNAYSNSGRYIYVETEPSEMEFKIQLNILSGTEGDLYGFDIAAKGLINTIFEPFVPQTFENSDCNPLYGNAVEDTPSTVYYDIDYSQNSITPVNFDTIIAGTADKAKLQDYNYFARRSIIPRYSGSRNTAADFNVLNGVIDKTDAIIVDFEWGGGTYPMIQDAGGLKLNRILLSGDNRDAINTVTSEMEGFAGNIKQAFPINSVPSITQYTTTSNNTAGARISAHGFTVPALPFAILPADSTGVKSEFDYWENSMVNPFFGKAINLSYGNTNNPCSFKAVKNASGVITKDYQITAAGLRNIVSDGIAAGEEWYVTFYTDMPDELQGTLRVYDVGYDTKSSDGSYDYPLRAKGVFKIIAAGTSDGEAKLRLENDATLLPTSGDIGGAGGNKGMIVWKAVQNDEFILFNDATMSGVGKGAFVTSTPSPIIEQNFDYITRTFGNNTSTS